MKKKLGIAALGLFVLFVVIGQSGKNKELPLNQSPQEEKTTPSPEEEESVPPVEGTSKADFSKLSPRCFTASSGNPILTNDSLFKGSHWNDPHVLKVGPDYVMYASSDHGFDKNVQIYRLISTDGITWNLSPDTPVFERSTEDTAWDRGSVETPAVVYFNGMYHLFYTGYPVLEDALGYRVGHATSPDGIRWTRQSVDTPLLVPTDPHGAPNFTFNQYFTAEPAPVVFNGKLYLYFTTMGVDNKTLMSTVQTIGLTTSSDGKKWSEPVQVLSPDQDLYPRTKGWIGYSTPHAQVLGGNVHLFFDVATEVPKWNQEKLHHAVSADGVKKWTQDKEAIFERGDFDWLKEDVRAPAVYLEGKKLMLWFAGTKDYTLGIGVATCAL